MHFQTLIFLSSLCLCALVDPSTSTDKVRGVNLGGWLVLEPFITPSIFEKYNVPDEYSLSIKLGQKEGRKVLEQHRKTFYVEDDFAKIASWGVNLVRVPIGYWAFDPDHLPYISGAAEYLDLAVEWGAKYNLTVLIDLHGLLGSQNGMDHSGRKGKAGWIPSEPRMPKVIAQIAKRYAANYTGTIAIQGANEPAFFNLLMTQSQIAVYFEHAYKLLREVSKDIPFWLHDAFLPYSQWTDQFKAPTYQRVVQDSHSYEVFSVPQLKNTEPCRLRAVCSYGERAQAYAESNIPTVVGEWSGAITDCTKYLLGYGLGSRYDGTFSNNPLIDAAGKWLAPPSTWFSPKTSCENQTAPITEWSDDHRQAVRKYIEAQMEAYDKANGWIFWTAKTERGPGTDASWDMGLLIENGIFPQPFENRTYPNICSSSFSCS